MSAPLHPCPDPRRTVCDPFTLADLRLVLNLQITFMQTFRVTVLIASNIFLEQIPVEYNIVLYNNLPHGFPFPDSFVLIILRFLRSLKEKRIFFQNYFHIFEYPLAMPFSCKGNVQFPLLYNLMLTSVDKNPLHFSVNFCLLMCCLVFLSTFPFNRPLRWPQLSIAFPCALWSILLTAPISPDLRSNQITRVHSGRLVRHTVTLWNVQ